MVGRQSRSWWADRAERGGQTEQTVVGTVPTFYIKFILNIIRNFIPDQWTMI